MTKKENRILLFSITLCWAASYVFVKSLPEDLMDYAYITMVTGLATLLLCIIFFRQLKGLTFSVVKKGFFLALLLMLNLLFDKMGIDQMTASAASFLASLSIIFVPLLLILLRRRPSKNNLCGALIILCGIVITSGASFSEVFGLGGMYIVLSTLSMSVYTILADVIAKEESSILLTIVEMGFCTLISFCLWFLKDPGTFRNVTYTREMLSSIFMLAFFSKAYAYTALMFAQKYSDAISVTVIASTEPVVTLLLAVFLPGVYGSGEALKASSLLGAVVIMCGAVVSGLNFLERRRNVEALK